jgi:hypothetical protein
MLDNTKSTVWSQYIQAEKEKRFVFKDIVNRQFQGEVAQGKDVKIIGAARPTVKTYTPGTSIDAAETIQDSSVFLKIDQYKYQHIGFDLTDKAKVDNKELITTAKQYGYGFANDADTYVLAQFANAGESVASVVTDTATKAKSVVDTAFEKLWDNNVKVSDKVSIVITPWFYSLFKDKLTELYTDNSNILETGVVGKYNGASVIISSNIYNDGTDHYIGVVCHDAIAFADKILLTKEDMSGFTETFRSLYIYGAKVVRPKEICVIKTRKS